MLRCTTAFDVKELTSGFPHSKTGKPGSKWVNQSRGVNRSRERRGGQRRASYPHCAKILMIYFRNTSTNQWLLIEKSTSSTTMSMTTRVHSILWKVCSTLSTLIPEALLIRQIDKWSYNFTENVEVGWKLHWSMNSLASCRREEGQTSLRHRRMSSNIVYNIAI